MSHQPDNQEPDNLVSLDDYRKAKLQEEIDELHAELEALEEFFQINEERLMEDSLYEMFKLVTSEEFKKYIFMPIADMSPLTGELYYYNTGSKDED